MKKVHEGRSIKKQEADRGPSDDKTISCSLCELRDVIDMPEIISLMEDLYELTGIGISVLDLDGKVLVETGSQDVCVLYHRKNPITIKNCLESDQDLAKNVERGKFRASKCKNGMWDVVTPIYIGDEHVGNLFYGRFFYEGEPFDRALFVEQAKKYGFDQKEYLDALGRVPTLSREKIETIMRLYARLTTLISGLGYYNMELKRENMERQNMQGDLLEKERFVTKVLNTIPNTTLIYDLSDHKVVFADEKSKKMFGLTSKEMMDGPEVIEDLVHPDDLELAMNASQQTIAGKEDEVHETEDQDPSRWGLGLVPSLFGTVHEGREREHDPDPHHRTGCHGP